MVRFELELTDCTLYAQLNACIFLQQDTVMLQHLRLAPSSDRVMSVTFNVCLSFLS